MNRCGFTRGFARNASESRAPQLWRGLSGVWSTSVGIQGRKLIDFARGNNGTTVGTWVGGIRGPALSTSTGAGVADTFSTQIIPLKPRTIIVSAKDDAPTTRRGLIGNRPPTGATGLIFGFENSTTIWVVYLNTTAYRLTIPARDSAWHTWALVEPVGTTSYFYRDGVLLGSVTTAADYTQPPGTNNGIIGGEQSGATGERWSGKISDTRIYNRALSAQEIMMSHISSPLSPRRKLSIYNPAVPVSTPKYRMFFSNF